MGQWWPTDQQNGLHYLLNTMALRPDSGTYFWDTAFTSFCSRSSVALQLQWRTYWGVGIAQWLERQTRVWKAVGSSHCMSGRRIFLSRVNFLCWLLFWYPFYPCVTAVACKRSWSSAKSAGGRLQLNMHAPYVCGFAWSAIVHGCMVYTEHAEMAAVSCGTSHVSYVSIPLWWIFKNALWKS